MSDFPVCTWNPEFCLQTPPFCSYLFLKFYLPKSKLFSLIQKLYKLY